MRVARSPASRAYSALAMANSLTRRSRSGQGSGGDAPMRQIVLRTGLNMTISAAMLLDVAHQIEAARLRFEPHLF
jgi:hypothetical protein